MYVGSLKDIIMESTYDYVDSIKLDLNDPVVLMGEVALHKTLEYEDTSYLWEFALNENDNQSGVSYSKNDDGTYTKTTKVYKRNGYIIGQGIDGKVLLLTNKSHRDAIGSRNYDIDDETKFNATKTAAIQNADSIMTRIKDSGLGDAKSVKNVNRNLQDYKEYVQNKEFPKSWLAKKIAWFRSLYEKFMLKNKYAKDPGVIGWIKHVLACIAKIIDTLLAKLQHAVN